MDYGLYVLIQSPQQKATDLVTITETYFLVFWGWGTKDRVQHCRFLVRTLSQRRVSLWGEEERKHAPGCLPFWGRCGHGGPSCRNLPLSDLQRPRLSAPSPEGLGLQPGNLSGHNWAYSASFINGKITL